MSKCLVVNGPSYFAPFNHLGLKMVGNANLLFEEDNDISLVVFTGGEDVTPELYGHKNMSSYNNEHRDGVETQIFMRAKELGIPMAGICRGAQFLCVMAGGTLVQDVTGHTEYHHLKFFNDDGEVEISPEKVTSTHHQVQYPWDVSHELIAWSSTQRSNHYAYNERFIRANDAPKELAIEPDVVFYPHIKALGIQYHPEWMPEDSWGFKYAQHVISNKLSQLIADNQLATGG